MRSPGGAALIAALALSIVAAGCGAGSAHDQSSPTLPPRTTTTRSPATTVPTTTAAPGTTLARPTSTASPTAPAVTAAPTATAPPPTAAATAPPTTPATSPAPAPLLVDQLSGIGSAQQVITVAASGYGTDTATVTAFDHGASGWRQVFGPWFAYIGRNGVAPIGAKREGDGRTPSGVYGFDFMFGVDPNPGVQFAWRPITGTNIVWDDDPASPNYNEWINTNTASAGVDPEPMEDTPSYDYGAVIAYNDARTPGLGSAIFLHVSHNSSTAGCVSLPADELVDLLRWLDPARDPRIAIGTLASLTS